MIDEKFIILAVMINLAGSSIYIIDTLRGKAMPNRVSWFLWALIPAITLLGMINEQAAKTSIIITAIFGLVPLFVLLVSFLNKKAYWKITPFDLGCGFFSLVAIAAWVLTTNGNLTIIFALIANFFSLLPTLFKSFKFPDTESWPAFFYAAISAFITLLTLQEWTFASVAFLLYVLATAPLLVLLIKFKVGLRLSKAL